MSEFIKILDEAAGKAGFNLTPLQLEQFDTYYRMLVETNKVMNLTALTEPQDVAVKHFVDSLMAYDTYFPGKVLADVGTGAGFPGIPLAIMLPQTNFVLIDSLDKRITFLKTVLEELGLSNVTLYHGRAEDFGKDTSFREQFNYCVSRAVAPLPILLEYCSPFIKVDGSLLLYKSIKTDQEVDESKHALDELNCKIAEICTLSDDEGYKRYIIEIHKINETPIKYPRKAGKPKKNPL